MNKWNDWELPTVAIIDGKSQSIRTDYRDILKIFQCFSDEELTQNEKIYTALKIFYKDYESIEDISTAYEQMFLFINCNKENKSNTNETQLVDWNKDIRIIIPPINKVMGTEIRSLNYLHWWSFMGAFTEIGECTFNTYVGIRDKKAKGKKLADYEKEIYRENKEDILIKSNIDLEFEKQMEGLV